MSTYQLIEAIFTVATATICIPLIIILIVKDYEKKKYSKRALIFLLIAIVVLTISLFWEGTKLL